MLDISGDNAAVGERVAACCDKHGVTDDMFWLIQRKLLCNRLDDIGGGKHTELYRVDFDVLKNRVNLLCDLICGEIEDGDNARGIFGDDGRDDACAVALMRREGFEVGLDTRAARAVGARDSKAFFHALHKLPPTKKSPRKARISLVKIRLPTMVLTNRFKGLNILDCR